MVLEKLYKIFWIWFEFLNLNMYLGLALKLAGLVLGFHIFISYIIV